MSGGALLKPRSKADRQQARLEQIAVWDYVLQSVIDDVDACEKLKELVQEALDIGKADGATPTLKLRALTVAGNLISLAHTIRKETIHDRTIPALTRVEVGAAMGNLPPSPEEKVAQESSVGETTEDMLARTKREVRDALRAAVAARVLGTVTPIDEESA